MRRKDSSHLTYRKRTPRDSTFDDYTSRLKLFKSWLGHEQAEAITTDDILRYKNHRLSLVSVKTVKTSDLAVLNVARLSEIIDKAASQ
jgi:hypothetical protein